MSNKDCSAEHLKIRRVTNTKYTEKQLSYVNGEKSISVASSQELSWLYPKTLANNDEELASAIKAQMDILKKQAKAHAAQLRNDRKRKIRSNIPIELRQPKSNKYTKHQEKVVKGEIPLNDVHTTELISIYMKAVNLGDAGLSDRIHPVILDRRAKEAAGIKRCDKHCKNRQKRSSQLYLDELSMLPKEQQELLLGDAHWAEFTKRDIEKMISSLERASNQKYLALAQEILSFKQNPGVKYRITNHEDAKDCLKRLFETALDKPRD